MSRGRPLLLVALALAPSSASAAGAAAAVAAQSHPVWLNPLITAASGLLGVFAGGYFATRNARAAIVQKTNELEIASIDQRLSSFIAPFEQLSRENLQLAHELKRRHGGAAFRTLPALLEEGWKDRLGRGDRTLVDAVVDNGMLLRTMILEHGGAASPAIRPHLTAAGLHFRMLALAYAASLDPDPDRYAEYVYPRRLDGALALERARLERRRELLRSRPDRPHPAIEDLVLPTALLMRTADETASDPTASARNDSSPPDA